MRRSHIINEPYLIKSKLLILGYLHFYTVLFKALYIRLFLTDRLTGTALAHGESHTHIL